MRQFYKIPGIILYEDIYIEFKNILKTLAIFIYNLYTMYMFINCFVKMTCLHVNIVISHHCPHDVTIALTSRESLCSNRWRARVRRLCFNLSSSRSSRKA